MFFSDLSYSYYIVSYFLEMLKSKSVCLTHRFLFITMHTAFSHSQFAPAFVGNLPQLRSKQKWISPTSYSWFPSSIKNSPYMHKHTKTKRCFIFLSTLEMIKKTFILVWCKDATESRCDRFQTAFHIFSMNTSVNRW